MNAFAHIREFPDVQFKVVRLNFDTLYSSAFLNVSAEPVIVSAPETNGRYYMLPMLDMWTDVSPCPESAPAVLAPAIGRSCPRDGTATFHREWSGLTHPRRTCGSSAAGRRIGQPTMNRFMPSKTVIASVDHLGGGPPPHPCRASSIPTMPAVTNGWQMNTSSMGVYGDLYAKRVVVAMLRLGANPPEDVIYPLVMADVDGDPVDGSRAYVLHFDNGDLPPVSAFWSLTMYDEHSFQAANELHRYAIGDRHPLQYNPDRTLDLYIGHIHPGRAREANWLPAPVGPPGITMRPYATGCGRLDWSLVTSAVA